VTGVFVAERNNRKFVMAGAGLGGALLAAQLGQAGYVVEVYERRSDPRLSGKAEGKSINLAISTRGFHALDQAGLKDQILEMAVPMSGRLMHDRHGRTVYQPYGIRADEKIQSVSRGDLNLAIIARADAMPNVTFHFEHRCTGCDLDGPSLEVQELSTGATRIVSGDVVVGADGAFSPVRRSMQKLDRFDYSQSYLPQCYKELVIPKAEDGGYRIDANVLHIWPRGGYMMIALPNLDGSFTVTLFWPPDGENGFDSLKNPDDVQAFFEKNFPDAVELMPDLAGDYFSNPTSPLVTVRCRPWNRKDKVVLIGDACHAVVPFYGQGANAAFEDCTVLMACIQQHPDDLAQAFDLYTRHRKDDVDVLADLAIANFNVMSEHVMSGGFLFRKKFERILHRLLPGTFLPLYTMISFTRMPYGAAVLKAARQDKILWWTTRIAAVALGALLFELLF
jgi:kynurenine 3-monooxygenase